MHHRKFQLNSGRKVFNLGTLQALGQVAQSSCETILGLFQTVLWRLPENVKVSDHPFLSRSGVTLVAQGLVQSQRPSLWMAFVTTRISCGILFSSLGSLLHSPHLSSYVQLCRVLWVFTSLSAHSFS